MSKAVRTKASLHQKAAPILAAHESPTVAPPVLQTGKETQWEQAVLRSRSAGQDADQVDGRNGTQKSPIVVGPSGPTHPRVETASKSTLQNKGQEGGEHCWRLE